MKIVLDDTDAPKDDALDDLYAAVKTLDSEGY